MFTGSMVTEAIPERVFALYKIVDSKKEKKIMRSELRGLMEPSDIREGSSYFAPVIKTAMELKLINEQDNMISVTTHEMEIKNIHDFRSYTISVLPEYESEQFWKCTNIIVNMNEEIYDYKSVSDAPMRNYLNERMEGEELNAAMMRGWRFWAQFLGIGYMNDMSFLPNSYLYVKEVIKLINLEEKKEYDFDEFMIRFSKYGKIILSEQPQGSYLNIAFSSALRHLHDNGEIELKTRKDLEAKWRLYPSNVAYNYPVSTIVYKGVK